MEDLTDQDRVELVQDILRRYGALIVGLIILSCVLIFGWQWWRHHQQETHVLASTHYQIMLNANQQKQFSLATEQAQFLLKHDASSTYASLASLYLATEAIKADQLTKAKAHINWVLSHNNAPLFLPLAKFELAQIDIASKQPEAAVKLLQPVPVGYDVSYHYLLGLAYQKLEQYALAKQAWQQALAAALKQDNAYSVGLLQVELAALPYHPQAGQTTKVK